MCDTKGCNGEARHTRVVFGTTYNSCDACHNAVNSSVIQGRNKRQMDRSRSYSNAVRNYIR